MEEIYKIVKIIDDETIVINAGLENNIKIGNKFEIFEIGEAVIDPDTNENLGTLDTVKDTVEVIHVFPKICICKHIIKYNYLSVTLPGIKTKAQTLNIDTTQISGGLISDLTIKIGDKTRLIQND